MVKGWRNDPRWVEVYERRERERVAHEIQRRKFEMEAARMSADLERSMRRLREPMPVSNKDWGY